MLCWLLISLVNELFLGSKPLRFLFLTEYSGFFAAGMLIYRLRAGKSGLASVPLLALSFAISVQTSLAGLDVIADKLWHGVFRRCGGGAGDWRFTRCFTRRHRSGHAAAGPAAQRAWGGHLSALSHSPAYRLHRIHADAWHGQRRGAVLPVIAGLILAAFAVWVRVERPLSRALRKKADGTGASACSARIHAARFCCAASAAL